MAPVARGKYDPHSKERRGEKKEMREGEEREKREREREKERDARNEACHKIMLHPKLNQPLGNILGDFFGIVSLISSYQVSPQL